jgi:glycosyltransferase involved in cell wall biosynthesis
MDMTVAIATFGSQAWQDLAESRAVPSALEQAPVIRVHGETLHDARNEALARVTSEWVVFLDGDDELGDGFIAAMATGSADMRAPAVSYIRGGRPRDAYVPRVVGHQHDCGGECVTSGDGNWLVIGTCCRTELVRAAGGFKDWPVYEDFDLWMRMLLAGATVEAIPAAVYKAWVNPSSRNRAPDMATKNATHLAIVAANLGEQAAA